MRLLDCTAVGLKRGAVAADGGVVRGPGSPDGLRPGAEGGFVAGRGGGGEALDGEGALHGGWGEPGELILLGEDLGHGGVDAVEGPAALEQEIEAREVDGDGTARGRDVDAGMLHGVGVDGELVQAHEGGGRVLAREDLAVDGPAAGRGEDVLVGRTGGIGKDSQAAEALHKEPVYPLARGRGERRGGVC